MFVVFDPKFPHRNYELQLNMEGDIVDYDSWQPEEKNKEDIQFYKTALSKAWLHYLGS